MAPPVSLLPDGPGGAASTVIRLGRVLDVEGARLRDLTAAAEGTDGGSALLRQRLTEARLAPSLNLSTNWAAFAVAVTAERVRLGAFAVEDEAPELWALWRSSVPASDEALFWASTLALGRGYLLSWKDEAGAYISVESPYECTHEVHPRTGEVVRALKRWIDGGTVRAILFEPDRITHLHSDQHDGTAELYGTADHLPPPVAVSAWTVERVDPCPLGRVPISAVVLRRSIRDTVGASDLEPLRGVQAAIDKVVVDALAVSEGYAAPRRWATGVEVPLDAEGKAVDPFATESGRTPQVLISEASESKFGAFPAVDLEGLMALHERLVEDLLSRASVPRHLSIGGSRGQQVNAESIRAAEAGLLARVDHRERLMGDGVGRAVRLAWEVATGVRLGHVEPVWRPAGTQSIAADADAVGKLTAAGVPVEVAGRQVLGWTSEQVAEVRTARRAAALDGIDLAGAIS